jgi:hypothetical protein
MASAWAAIKRPLDTILPCAFTTALKFAWLLSISQSITTKYQKRGIEGERNLSRKTIASQSIAPFFANPKESTSTSRKFLDEDQNLNELITKCRKLCLLTKKKKCMRNANEYRKCNHNLPLTISGNGRPNFTAALAIRAPSKCNFHGTLLLFCSIGSLYP